MLMENQDFVLDLTEFLENIQDKNQKQSLSKFATIAELTFHKALFFVDENNKESLKQTFEDIVFAAAAYEKLIESCPLNDIRKKRSFFDWILGRYHPPEDHPVKAQMKKSWNRIRTEETRYAIYHKILTN